MCKTTQQLLLLHHRSLHGCQSSHQQIKVRVSCWDAMPCWCMLLFFAKFVLSQQTFWVTCGQGAAGCFSKASVSHQPDIVSNRLLTATI